ncbi:MAG: hypothetical protein KBF23_06135 [Agitococcus sp.]|jgi:hypothetical protein|nr:hypothetical protein [Agitococcus sp.]
MSKTIKSFNFHQDAGHGWLCVKRKALEDADLLNQVSDYSYQRGESVYLEEDCDMGIWIKHLESNGIQYTLKYKHAKNDHPSPIRNYDGFSKNH